MTTDTASFELHRSLPLAPARLWRVLTDPVERAAWNAPAAGMTATVEVADLRVGGFERHHYTSGGTIEDMPDFTAETRWYHLASPTRAVFTETVVIEGELQFTSLVTYVLRPAAAGADLTVSVATSSFTGPEMLDGLSQGWEGGLANLEAHISKLAQGAPR